MPSETYKINTNSNIDSNIYKMTLNYPHTAAPGQFYMLKNMSAATLLPRPISVCDYENGVLTFLYQVVGKGTAELAAMRPGDELLLTGPLGNGFPVSEYSGRIALVGGGIGVAPLLYTAKILKDLGCKVDMLCGWRDAPFLTGELEAVSGSLAFTTQSGRAGIKGVVTDILQPDKYNAVFACGPESMMKAVTDACVKAGTPVFVSLERKMACGVGGCLVCACADKQGKNRRVCKDGPVFHGNEVF